jgi:plasmid stabilization system protein ParE
MYRLRVLRKAREDMQKSADWYNERQEGLGDRFLLKMVGAFRSIETNPLHYQVRYSKDFRFAREHDFSFVVVFKINYHLVIVLAVFHSSRNPKRFV